jgi:hypothetical protein
MRSAPRTIFETKTFVDGDARQMTEMVVVSGPMVPDAPRFIAHGRVKLKAGNREIEEPINVVLQNAEDLVHAFQMHDAAIKSGGEARVEQLKNEHPRSKLADTGGILLPKRK